MKPISLLFTVVLFAALATITSGCTTEGNTEFGQDTTAVADTANQAFNYTGDFDGPLGLQLYSIRNAMEADVPGMLAWVRRAGFQEVELAGTYGLTPEAFKQELDKAGLTASAMHSGYERFRDSLSVVLDEAELFGVEYVGVAWIPHDGAFTVEQARQAAAHFNEWGRAASERGLTFFYHNHGYEYQPTEDGTIPFEVLAEETNPEDVKFEMDAFWTFHPGLDPAEHLRQYPNRWALMHVKDMREGTERGGFSGHAEPETNVAVGTGMIDWPEILKAAEEVGVERYYIEDESPDPLDSIPESAEYLQQVTFAAE